MNKKALIYGSISLGFGLLMAFGISKLNTNNVEDEFTMPTDVVTEKLSPNNKITVSHYSEDDSLEMEIVDYNLDDKEILEKINWGIKKLGDSNDELLNCIEEVKEELKNVNNFEYDDTGVYFICHNKRVGDYEVSVEVTDEEYIGYPLVTIRIARI